MNYKTLILIAAIALVSSAPAHAFFGPLGGGDASLDADETVTGDWTFDSAITHRIKVYNLADLSDSDCADSADVCTLTATEVSNTQINTYGWDGANDCNMQLPAAGKGMKVLFQMAVTDADQDFYIDVSDNQIYLDSDPIGDGERVWTEEPTIAESILCYTFSIDGGTTYDWACNSINGVFADKGS
jgi:hypothetical protein